jgi:UDP-N-acetylmuramyl tripeptide synthase
VYWGREWCQAGVPVVVSGQAYAGTQRPRRTRRDGARVGLGRWAARLAARASQRLRGGSGLVIGGRVLTAVAPDGAAVLGRGRRVLLVSGTNGKTTTTALLATALTDQDPIGSNRGGANTRAGLAGTLATSDAQVLVLEVDESWLPWAVRTTAPRCIVLTNLTRDQLSRHHEVSALAASWHTCLEGATLVIANADDPEVVWAASGAQARVWVSVGEPWTADSVVCPACGDRCLRTDHDWACASCDLRRPTPDWWLEGSDLCSASGRVPLHLDLPGRFNLGNAALALVAAATEGVPVVDSAPRLTSVGSVAGRFWRVHHRDHDLRVMLAKNPAGWLELIELMAPDRHPVVLVFNADGVDGRDPSWLYDVSFVPLRGREIVVQGRRAADLVVRLELDGVAARRVGGRLADGLAGLPPGRVDVVGNYTAFQAAVAELRRA